MSLQDFENIAPTLPVAPYLGGKSKLAERIIRTINRTPHATYAEPFAGMGGVFLRRDKRPKCEVVNDINKELITLFRILQRHYPQFIDTLKFQVTSRASFERLRSTDPDTLTDLERAARFLYLQKIGFGGKVNGSYGVQVGMPGRFDLSKIEPILEEFHERFTAVVIECKPYADFIEIYDRPETLFYLDPPYWNGENDYGKDVFSRDDFFAMNLQLSDIQGKFILSLNDLPEVRECFASFHQQAVETTYSISSSTQKVSELLISNYEIDLEENQGNLF